MKIKNNKNITLKSLVISHVNKGVEKQYFDMQLVDVQVVRATLVVNFGISFYSYF